MRSIDRKGNRQVGIGKERKGKGSKRKSCARTQEAKSGRGEAVDE